MRIPPECSISTQFPKTGSPVFADTIVPDLQLLMTEPFFAARSIPPCIILRPLMGLFLIPYSEETVYFSSGKTISSERKKARSEGLSFSPLRKEIFFVPRVIFSALEMRSVPYFPARRT